MDDREVRLGTEWALLTLRYPRLKGWRLYVNDRLSRRAGQCCYSKKSVEIARWHLERSRWEEVRETLLHEVAHALAPRSSHHNYIWRQWAVAVGARPERCYSMEVAQDRDALYNSR